jgi:predicted metal-dependent hydrolase
VGLLHFTNGNLRGAAKLYRTSRTYMENYPSPYLGLDIEAFWKGMERCHAELLRAAEPDATIQLHDELIPTIELHPPPETWPDPADFAGSEDA